MFIPSYELAAAQTKDDGVTEIKKYIVEALDVSSGTEQWAQVAVANSESDRKIKVEGLTNKHRYRFRVRAANKLGPSDPCEMLGDDICIKDPWGRKTFKYFICLKHMTLEYKSITKILQYFCR